MAAQGRDIKLAESRVEGSRNFATKLWNAARFCEINECALTPGFEPAACEEVLNRWVVGATARCAQDVEAAIAAYRFNDASQVLYHFIWGTFCDWYVELSKPLITGDDAAAQAETRATTAWVLAQTLKMLHPFMPFITEELWTRFGDSELLILESWPQLGPDMIDAEAQAEMDWVVALITGVRSVRSEMNIPPGAKIPMLLTDASDTSKGWMKRHNALITRLARLQPAEIGNDIPKGAVQFVHGEAVAALLIADVIDLSQEKARLEKAIAKTDSEASKLEKKLGNAQFMAKAPEAVIAEQRERLAAQQATREKLADALTRVSAAM